MIKFSKDKVLLLHKLIAQETGGSIGLRDEALLDSALENAFAGFDGQEFYPTKEEKGARLGLSLIHILFVTSEDIYLSLEGENVLANRDKTVVARYPLHTLQAIVSFSYAGASPALMGKCAEAGIGLALDVYKRQLFD